MSTIESICVYCASGPGNNPAFIDAATKLGRILAENGIRLVYGGGSVGLMGALAEAVLDHGGTVIGVIPDFLVNREHMLLRVQERVITPDMHERKRVMFERADAFVALPGGVGTLEEMERLDFIRAGLPVTLLVAEQVEEILPQLLEAVRSVSEAEKKMTSVAAGRM